jgi:hypothetical protein
VKLNTIVSASAIVRRIAGKQSTPAGRWSPVSAITMRARRTARATHAIGLVRLPAASRAEFRCLLLHWSAEQHSVDPWLPALRGLLRITPAKPFTSPIRSLAGHRQPEKLSNSYSGSTIPVPRNHRPPAAFSARKCRLAHCRKRRAYCGTALVHPVLRLG